MAVQLRILQPALSPRAQHEHEDQRERFVSVLARFDRKLPVTDVNGTAKQNWLESAFLEKQAGNWKIVFMRSTRVPRPTGNLERRHREQISTPTDLLV
jgi:hypothetical protein